MIYIDLNGKKIMFKLYFIFSLILLHYQLLFSIKFVWLTDTHVEIDYLTKRDDLTKYSQTKNLLKNVVEYCNDKNDIDFVIISGDLINSAKSWNLDTAKYILSKLNKPYFVVIGNNDFSTPSDGIGTGKYDFHFVFKKNEPNFDGTFWYKHFNNTLLIGIDNINPIDQSAIFDDNFIHGFKKILRLNKTFKNKVVILHYPIFEYNFKSNGKIQDIAKQFVSLCHQYNITLVLSGHYNYTENHKIDNTLFLIQPPLSSYPFEFSLITINEKTITIQRKTLANDILLNNSKEYLKRYYKINKQSFGNIDFNTFLLKIVGKEKTYEYKR